MAGAYASLAGIATYLWPEVCVIRVIPYPAFLLVGVVLLLIGIPMLIVAGRAAMMAYNSDKLATTGIFGLTRNPIYAAWIVFIIPGLMVLCRSWPLLLTPVVAYVSFKVWIRRENDYLEQRFGHDYQEYRARVNELIPWPKFWQRERI
jgi:protein-S-isoprenylcysteine O-methyltransferase Ste14